MKKRSVFLLAAALTVGIGLQAEEVKVDTNQSTLTWVGKKVTGQHEGTIKAKSGSISLDGERITGGTFVIDLNSIVCTDITDADSNQKLVGHLKSDDFFSVEKYPEATLVIKEATAFQNNQAHVKGELTLKGTTQPIEFDVTKDGQVYQASISVDRSKYNVRYGSKSFFSNLGDNLIYDNFEIGVKLVLKK